MTKISEILLMEEILHQLIGRLSHYLQVFFTYFGWLTGCLASTVVKQRIVSGKVFRVVWVVVARDSPISEVIIEVLLMRCTKRLQGWGGAMSKGLEFHMCSIQHGNVLNLSQFFD